MANITLVDIASSAIDVVGTPQVMDGARVTLSITATSYGTDGKIVIKYSADGVDFFTLDDASTGSGLAEYSANIALNVDRLPLGWSIRVDLEISSGTATGVKVIMGG